MNEKRKKKKTKRKRNPLECHAENGNTNATTRYAIFCLLFTIVFVFGVNVCMCVTNLRRISTLLFISSFLKCFCLSLENLFIQKKCSQIKMKRITKNHEEKMLGRISSISNSTIIKSNCYCIDCNKIWRKKQIQWWIAHKNRDHLLINRRRFECWMSQLYAMCVCVRVSSLLYYCRYAFNNLPL